MFILSKSLNYRKFQFFWLFLNLYLLIHSQYLFLLFMSFFSILSIYSFLRILKIEFDSVDVFFHYAQYILHDEITRVWDIGFALILYGKKQRYFIFKDQIPANELHEIKWKLYQITR
jgi:hypothetical protein